LRQKRSEARSSAAGARVFAIAKLALEQNLVQVQAIHPGKPISPGFLGQVRKARCEITLPLRNRQEFEGFLQLAPIGIQNVG
jgi:hypothetical protein